MTLPIPNSRPTDGVLPRSSAYTGSPASRRLRLGGMLLGGCVFAVLAAAAVGHPEPLLQADPELARLLRGMALLKAAIVVAALAALLWRFGQPLSNGLTVAYLAGASAAAGACMLIWQLEVTPTAVFTFHLGELTLLVAAWRDHAS
ncbi:MAG: hypothetical protein WBG86_06475 [Polyangiales bacterium]